MNIRNLVLGLTLTTLFPLLLPPEGLAAQTFWATPNSQRSIELEVTKPFFDGGDFSAASSATYLSVNWPFSEKVRFVGEIPLAYGSYENEYDEGESDLTMGNPYLGVSIGKEESSVSGQVGLRLPLASSNADAAQWVGLLSTLVGRGGAFFPDLVPVLGTITYQKVEESGLAFLATGGADAWFATEGSGDRVEAFLVYGTQLGYVDEEWSVMGGFAGRAVLTEEEWIGNSRASHELSLDFGYRHGRIEPKLYVRFPVGSDVSEMVDLLMGAGIRIVL